MTKQIDIQELIPYLKQGWVAMDKSGHWYWYDMSIIPAENHWVSRKSVENICPLANIKPVEDWTKSLIKVENKDE